jgi:hypothetical protein
MSGYYVTSAFECATLLYPEAELNQKDIEWYNGLTIGCMRYAVLNRLFQTEGQMPSLRMAVSKLIKTRGTNKK